MTSQDNPLKCPVCKSPSIYSLYHGPLRSGTWGSWTPESYEVYSCSDCSLGFLENPNLDPYFYQSEEYRKTYNQDASIENILTQHRKTDLLHFDRIGRNIFEAKVVADVGASAGGFLDFVKPLAKKTIAVEPAQAYHSHLRQSHEVYSYVTDLKNSGQKIDVITSLNVIEHAPDPVEFVGSLRDCLNPNGKILLVTPNLDDILNKLIFKDFSRYFFRTAHLFYFNKNSIETLLTHIGLHDISVDFIHKYDLDNMISWLRNRQIGGDKPTIFETAAMNIAYIEAVETQRLSSHLLIRCGV